MEPANRQDVCDKQCGQACGMEGLQVGAFSAETFAGVLAIIGIVIVVSALLSGLIERSGLPQVAVFLGIGAALGPAGLGLMNLQLDSPALRVVATLSLTLVLFTDAVSLNIQEVRLHSKFAFRVLGPGTLLSAALVALAGWWLLGLPPAGAAILGAALASTDPVLLRGVLRRRDIPAGARQVLKLESGLNDAVLLPVVIVAMAFLQRAEPLGPAAWAKLSLNLFVLGPGAGVAVGLLAVAALDLIRKRLGVRRDYESLYSLGVAFTAFAAAEAVNGSGFLAAFAAGLTIAALDVELCDCFIEYGEVTAEMMLLFTFVLFGSSLIWRGVGVISGATLLFTAIVIMIRPPVYALSLYRSGLDRRGRRVIEWFGPRGLSSLLLILLPVFEGLPGSERLFAVCCLVVLTSVVVHGGSPMLLARSARRRALQDPDSADLNRQPGLAPPVSETPAPSASQQPPAPRTLETSSLPLVEQAGGRENSADRSDDSGARSGRIHSQSISIDELRQLLQRNEPVVFLDVRTTRSFEASDSQARGSVRMPPDHVAARAAELNLPREAWLVAYCA